MSVYGWWAQPTLLQIGNVIDEGRAVRDGDEEAVAVGGKEGPLGVVGAEVERFQEPAGGQIVQPQLRALVGGRQAGEQAVARRNDETADALVLELDRPLLLAAGQLP